MPQQEIPSQRCMARAMYDNVAEAPDELVFRKGDLLTVLEQNTSGLEGWWLCVLRGRQGICPGNRLKIVAGMYANESNELVSSATGGGAGNDFNTLQKQGKRRSWNVQPNKVMTPQKVGDVFLYDVAAAAAMQKYDVPRAQNWAHPQQTTESSYDIPPTPIPVQTDYANLPSNLPPMEAYDVPQNRTIQVVQGDAYDVPRSLNCSLDTPPSRLGVGGGRLSPSSSISSLTTNSDSVSSSSASNRSSSFMSEYDVPRSATKVLMSQSFPSQLPSSRSLVQHHPVELQESREHLQRAETEVVTSINKLISFASPEWRSRDSLEPRLPDIQAATRQLQTSLHEFTLFTQRCLSNASKCEDKSLYTKLNTLVNCLLDSDRIIHEACRSLSDQGWDINRLAREPGDKIQPDSLDQLIVICIKSLLDHVKTVSTFIQGNSPILFKRPSTTTDGPSADTSSTTEWTSDDYVKASGSEPSPAALLTGEEGTYEMLTNRNDVPTMDRFNLVGDGDRLNCSSSGGYADKQALLFYAAQIASLSLQLTTAIDLFLQTVEHNQPPRVFLSHSMLVLMSAYRLVYIGDTVGKNLMSGSEMKNKLTQCSNLLCDTLGTAVHKTRKAALQFPSVTAVQEMVDSVVDISHVARDLKIGIIMCAQHT
uniref:Breast cancer anti-estrogen resistance protein 1 n=1 Tax=Cacopsylla melanoneura TaxID=428564 RepID=A0A8D8ZV33_9HEMI